MRSEIFKILKGAVFGALFLLCGAAADEAKFKPMLLKEYIPGMNITGWVVSEKLDSSARPSLVRYARRHELIQLTVR